MHVSDEIQIVDFVLLYDLAINGIDINSLLSGNQIKNVNKLPSRSNAVKYIRPSINYPTIQNASNSNYRKSTVKSEIIYNDSVQDNHQYFEADNDNYINSEDNIADHEENFPKNELITGTEVARSQNEIEQESNEMVVEISQKMSLSKTNRKLKVSEAPSSLNVIGGNSSNPAATDSFKTISSESFPMAGLSEIGSSSSSEHGIKVDPKSWLLYTKPNDNEPAEEYVNMYWLDASENNGLLYLFGKVPINQTPPNSGAASQKFVSCCVVVHGSERNLFVLPKVSPDTFKEDGTACRVGMSEVYQEITSILVPDIVPRVQGQSFKVKSVKRKYAFEHGTIPRETTDYMKVVYSAKHGVPSTQQCQGGKKYERIFGAGSSCLELFLLKRKLMGPCWIKIKNPRLNTEVSTWCRIEIAVENPKFITKVPQADSIPAPPLVSMCVSMKTAVNPVTHLHEIIALSGFVHTKVDSEAETDNNPKFMRRFTLVRQLGISCGNAYPAVFPHDLQQELKKTNGDTIQTMPNERALLSLFFSKIQQEDPDLFASHNLLGFEFDVLLARALVNKLPNWSILGRLKKTKPPKGINDKDVAAGRILCDTYKAAKEFLRETTYSLTYLASSQLAYERPEIDPIDVPKYFTNSKDIVKIANHTMGDAVLVQRLMLKLQVVPLTKQLTNLSGNLWSRTIRGARAERIEYLLLHEFHSLKFILPEKKAFDNSKKSSRTNAAIEDDADDLDGKVGGMSRNKAKAAYAGGLVLEPKKGLYDTFILLLDFNSLYPSIIQEYNLCFTTINWTKFMNDTTATNVIEEKENNKNKDKNKKKTKKDSPNKDHDDDDEDDAADEDDFGAETVATGNKNLPPLPDTSAQPGILPKVIKNLVDRRREVKKLLKQAKEPALRQQLDIRQKALKLTANSMYGCLGFSFSRFYARPIAALVTAMGREALQRTVDLATNQMGLDVIYGDTDSVMINTGLTDLAKVKEIGNMVKKEVNKLYKSLELDLDGIFKSMLLLKKKKYAAVVINEQSDGTLTYEKELKGLDLVRRDWCPLSKDTGKFVVDQILSGNPREEIVMTIHDYLSDLSTKIRTGAIELGAFVVTKGLNKNPKDYPDCKGQAHLQVALQMLKANKPVNIGDHIPYVICIQGPEGSTPAQRAYHPDDVFRSNGQYTLDYEWYLSTQILPPISRLCEPIEGTSPAIMSERLGLDVSK